MAGERGVGGQGAAVQCCGGPVGPGMGQATVAAAAAHAVGEQPGEEQPWREDGGAVRLGGVGVAAGPSLGQQATSRGATGEVPVVVGEAREGVAWRPQSVGRGPPR